MNISKRFRPLAALFIAGAMTLGLGTPVGAVQSNDASAPANQTWDPYAPDVTIAEASAGKRLHFPSAELLRDGSVIAVVREGASHVGQDGRLVLTRSFDGGSTWAPSEIVLDTEFDERDPMITQTSSGRLLLSYFQIDWNVSPRQLIGTFVMHSDDLGTTWSDPVQVGSSLSGESDLVDAYELGWAASHGQIKEVGNGELIIPLYGTTTEDKWQRSVVVRSYDDGETWLAENESVIAAERGTHFQEPVLTPLQDGSIVALLRIGASASTTGAFDSQTSRSFDGGRTWSKPELIDLPTSSAHTEVLSNGDVFLAYGDLSNEFSPRRATVGAIIENPEEPWIALPRALIYDSLTGDQANPAVVEVAPNRILVVGFDTAKRTMVGTFVSARGVLNPNENLGDPRRLDLLGMHGAGQMDVATNMTYTNRSFPDVGVLGAVDSVPSYHSASWAAHSAPAFYELSFTEPIKLREIGLALKPGYAEAAVIEVSLGGGAWQLVKTVDYQIGENDLTWHEVEPQEVDKVRVRIERSDGWAILSELAIRAVPAD